MKLLFILPAIGQKEHEKYIGTWQMEPLTVATLKALTPPDVETLFFDDRIEAVDYGAEADLVAISVETYTARRAYGIAGEFRRRGVPVVMGGYHVTAAPEEAKTQADSIIVGNAEGVWARMLEDFKRGNLQAVYAGGTAFSHSLPDRTVYAGKKYLPLTLIETGRGCPHRCEFCAVTAYYRASYTPRGLDDVIREVRQSKNRFIFFVDDNVSAQRENLVNLCKALIPLKIKWAGQASLQIANDDELLRLLRQSGCRVLLIGFESMDKRNLDQMKKSWNYRLGERDEMVRKIHGAGIGIYATFVFGFDFDDAGIFDDTVAFAMKHKFFFAAFNHMLPFPGTPSYARLKQDGRLRYERWWLKDGYRYGDIPYEPLAMDPECLKNRCAAARRAFFRPLSILKRACAAWLRNPDLLLSFLCLTQNINLGKEVDRKLNLPVGDGLEPRGI
ncbi:MAG: radical SAM protein [Clostridiales Family XIII bacterium]|jgi:radical SAM superfamily enzyme YgiQ (UPF0313 family)|nr:radical SAM protein [Clostridiales Family XIII bacterium]